MINKHFKKGLLLGCSGVGMHGLVNLCRDLNIELDGVDEKPCLSSDLKYLGKVCLENVSDFKYDFVSYSGAISKTNPIIRRAFDLGIPVKHRYEFLNDLLGDKKKIVVTGSHGKSTTTAMITTVVQNFYGGSYYIGAKFLQDGRYAKFDSQSEWAIIEADESDGLFLKNRADIGVVTVSDSEHLDFWRSKRVLDLAFYSFILTCKELCILGQEFWFNFAWEKSKINSVKTKVCSINLGPEGTEYHISIDDRDLFGFIPFWGEHYVKNLAIALAVCRRLGICEHDAADILKNYRGLSRRMEVLSRNPLIISDYAHHPSEVKVTIEALSSVFDKLVVFYQPHRLSRIKKTFSEHRGLFLKCSKAFVLPVFEPNNFSGEILMKEESLEFGKQLSEISGATFIENFEETLRKFISERSWQIVVLGAGDIDERTRVIPSRIVSPA